MCVENSLHQEHHECRESSDIRVPLPKYFCNVIAYINPYFGGLNPLHLGLILEDYND